MRKRVVIKFGSGILTAPDRPELDPEQFEALVSAGRMRPARMDVFGPIEGTYDLILSFNLLQRNYFPADRIALGVENLGRALEEDGLLVIGNTESFAALRKRDGRLVPVLGEGVLALERTPA